MKPKQQVLVEWALIAVLVLVLVWILTGVACSAPPMVEIDSPGRGAASDATLTLGAWTVQELAGPSGPVWIVLPGDLVHRVKGEAPPPTTAAAAHGGAGLPAGPGVPWGWLLALVAAAAAGWALWRWWPRAPR